MNAVKIVETINGKIGKGDNLQNSNLLFELCDIFQVDPMYFTKRRRNNNVQYFIV